MAKKITAIPATLTRFSSQPLNKPVKKKVAGYARVSTDNIEQASSYEAQVDYYTNYIKSKHEWKFVDVYTDEGITGTNTDHREGFKKMMKDAMNGKIDLIITKSVSRFARNTVDSLTAVRKLKEKGVEIYFEKENIWTLDSKGELLITIMSSLAQEESRSISENCTWGIRKRFADGKVTMCYGKFLGYRKGTDGTPEIVEEEAEIVRWIYSEYLQGETPSSIANKLNEKGIKPKSKAEQWRPTTVENILSNEKYAGNALLQKKFTVDYLTKKQKINEGEVPQYYVENSHPAIISEDVYLMAQEKLKEATPGNRHRDILFCGMIYCGKCGSKFGSRIWHSNDKYRRRVWVCNNRYKTNCHTDRVTDEEVMNAFIKAFNTRFTEKQELGNAMDSAKRAAFDTTLLQEERTGVHQRIEELGILINQRMQNNSFIIQDQNEFESRQNALFDEYNELVKREDKLISIINDKKTREAHYNQFVEEMDKHETLLDEFDKKLFYTLVEKVVVFSRKKIKIHFKDGSII